MSAVDRKHSNHFRELTHFEFSLSVKSEVRKRTLDELTDTAVPLRVFTDFVSDKLRDGFTGRYDLFAEIERFCIPPRPATASDLATLNAAGASNSFAAFLTHAAPAAAAQPQPDIKQSADAAASSGAERVLLITGEPGIGKSTATCKLINESSIQFPRDLVLEVIPSPELVAIISAYVAGYDLSKLHARLIGYHICMASNDVTLSAIRFVHTFTLQLCHTVPGFADKLFSSRDPLLALRSDDARAAMVSILLILKETPHPKAQAAATGDGDAEDEATAAAPVASASATANSSGDAKSAKSKKKKRKSKKREELSEAEMLREAQMVSDRARFILVDSLDESLCIADPKRSIAALLSSREVLTAMPEWLRVVSTSRPDRNVFTQFEQWTKPFVRTIAADGAENRADVAAFVRNKLRIDRMKTGATALNSSATTAAAGTAAAPVASSSAAAASTAVALAADGGPSAVLAVSGVVNSGGAEENPITPNELIQKTVLLCAGNFLVASEIVRSVMIPAPAAAEEADEKALKDSDLPPPPVVPLSTGYWSLSALAAIVNDSTLKAGNLSSYYTSFMHRATNVDDQTGQKWYLLRIIIEVLLATPEPVQTDHFFFAIKLNTNLAGMKKKGDRAIEPYLRLIQPFIRREKLNLNERHWHRPPQMVEHISLYHKSFSDWLRTLPEDHRFYVKVTEGHRRLAGAALLCGPLINPKMALQVMSGLFGAGNAAPAGLIHPNCLRKCDSTTPAGETAAHFRESHLDVVLHHLRCAAITSTKWRAFAVPELCYFCSSARAEAGANSLIRLNDLVGIQCITPVWKPDRAYSSLLIAVSLGYHAIIKELWPLCRATDQSNVLCYGASQSVLDLLCELGAKPAEVRTTNIKTALAAELLWKSRDRNVNKLDVFNPEISHFLLRWACEHGANVNACNSLVHRTLLGRHVQWNNAQHVAILLEFKADPDQRYGATDEGDGTFSGGETALMAASTKHPEVLALLLAAVDPAKNTIREMLSVNRDVASAMASHVRWADDPLCNVKPSQ